MPHDEPPEERAGEQPAPEILTLDHAGRRVELWPGGAHAGMDRLLAELAEETWVFLPVPEGGMDGAGADAEEATEPGLGLEGLRSRLDGVRVLDGLQHAEDGAAPGLFAFGLPRAQARELAAELGLSEFVWGARGQRVEWHPVDLLQDEDAEDESMLDAARGGLRALLTALRELVNDPLRAGFTPATRRELAVCAGLLLAWAAAVHALCAVTDLAQVDGPFPWLLHPTVFPTLACGVYLRRRLPELRAGRPARELTRPEAQQVWSEFAPHLAALWAVAVAGVGLLAGARLWDGTRTFAGVVDDVPTQVVACVWCIPPIAYWQRVESIFGALLQAALSVFVSILVMRLTLALAGLGADILWGLVAGRIPWQMPEGARELVDLVVEALAAVGFLATMLGYSWTKQRERFELWVSGELPA